MYFSYKHVWTIKRQLSLGTASPHEGSLLRTGAVLFSQRARGREQQKKREQQFHLSLLVLRSFYCSHAKTKIASSSTEHSSICLPQADSASVQIIVNAHLLG